MHLYIQCILYISRYATDVQIRSKSVFDSVQNHLKKNIYKKTIFNTIWKEQNLS